jgi:hypothetical protein
MEADRGPSQRLNSQNSVPIYREIPNLLGIFFLLPLRISVSKKISNAAGQRVSAGRLK